MAEESGRRRRMMTPEERAAARKLLRDRMEASRPKYEAIVRRLIAAVPEVQPICEKHRREWKELLIYPLFEGQIWPHSLLLLELRSDQDQVRRIFDFVEELSAGGDTDEHSLAGIGFIQNAFGDGVSGLAWPFMGVASRSSWLESEMWQIQETPAEYDARRSTWMAEVARLGGPEQISVRDAYEIWMRVASLDKPGGEYRSH
jgi:hypothetical protein